jgi:small subunit ribosomal protein S21
MPWLQYVLRSASVKAMVPVLPPPDFTLDCIDAKYCRRPVSSGPGRIGIPGVEKSPVQVLVRENNVDQALRALKKKMQREGVFREMKLRRNYEKPSERRAREKAEAVRRHRKLLRKRLEREGY